MIRQKVDWRILSECDGQSVRNIVQYGEREARTVTRLLPSDEFNLDLRTNTILRDCYDMCTAAYKALDGLFLIRHDSYGGYNLIYNGSEPIQRKTLLKNAPFGFLAPIPDDISDLSVVYRTSGSGEMMCNLMLGPIRFINSDCDPNCEYDMTSQQKSLVRIRTKKVINPGEEVTVKYGDRFFEAHSCLCKTCSLEKLRVTALLTTIEEEIFNSILSEIVGSFLGNELGVLMRRDLKHSKTTYNRVSKSARIDFLYSFADRDVSLPACNGQLDNLETSGNSSKVQEASNETIESGNELILGVNESFDDEGLTFATDSDEDGPPSCHFTDLVSSITSSDTVAHTSNETTIVPLYPGSTVGVHNANLLIRAFVSNNNLDDVASRNLYETLGHLLPDLHQLPSPFSHVYQMKKKFTDDICVRQETEKGMFCISKFSTLLSRVVMQNMMEIVQYSSARSAVPQAVSLDVRCDVAPPIHFNDDTVHVSLALSSDGVSVTQSSTKNEVWPIWLSILQLPPRLRAARKNIVLAGLFVGEGKPPWDCLIGFIGSELQSGGFLELPFRCRIKFKVVLLVADMIAKASMLNMYQHNGHYGCHFCTVPGKTIGVSHCYYPFSVKGDLREPDFHETCVRLAENESFKNVCGVKGKSAFQSIVSGLPLSAGIDYMHCVLLGVFPELLKLLIKLMPVPCRNAFTKQVLSIHAPKEVTAHGRAFRGLDELGHFKANEYYNYLFYACVVLLKDKIPDPYYQHFLCLSFGVRLLLEPLNEVDIETADHLLNRFCRDLVDLHDKNDKLETINVHSLLHLCEQTKRYGPLGVFSAMSFESANRLMSSLFSGTRSHCDVIFRRYLEMQRLSSSKVEDDRIRDICLQACNARDNLLEIKNSASDVLETDSVKFVRNLHPEASIYSRHLITGVLFDSSCYRRCPYSPNGFIQYESCGMLHFAKIECFVQFQDVEMFALVKLFNKTGELKIRDCSYKFTYFHAVELTEKLDLIPCFDFKKMCSIYTDDAHVLASIVSAFEHK